MPPLWGCTFENAYSYKYVTPTGFKNTRLISVLENGSIRQETPEEFNICRKKPQRGDIFVERCVYPNKPSPNAIAKAIALGEGYSFI